MFKDIFLRKSDFAYDLDHFLLNTHFWWKKSCVQKMCTAPRWIRSTSPEKWMHAFNRNADQIWTLLAPQSLPSRTIPASKPPKNSRTYAVSALINPACFNNLYQRSHAICSDLNIFPECYICDTDQRCDLQDTAMVSLALCCGSLLVHVTKKDLTWMLFHALEDVSVGSTLFPF